MKRRITVLLSVVFAGALIGGSPALASMTDTNCGDYATQADAQAAYDANPEAHKDLDRDGDGIACESYNYGSPSPSPSVSVTATPSVSPATTRPRSTRTTEAPAGETLPKTPVAGGHLPLIAGGAGSLVIAGSVLFFAARTRRNRFTA